MKILIAITLSILTSMAGPLVFDGGTQDAALPAQIMQTLPGGYSTTNFASSNKTGAQMISGFPSVAALGPSSDALLVSIGSVDLANGASVATVKSTVTQYMTTANSYFMLVGLMPIMPRSTNIGNFNESNRLTLNAWYATNFTNIKATNTYLNSAWVLPASYEPRIYAYYDHSWPEFTSGNPWFLNASMLNAYGTELQAAAVRHMLQKAGVIPTGNPAYTVGTAARLTISGIKGNDYAIYSAVPGGPWEPWEIITLDAPTVIWVDNTGSTGRSFAAAGLEVE